MLVETKLYNNDTILLNLFNLLLEKGSLARKLIQHFDVARFYQWIGKKYYRKYNKEESMTSSCDSKLWKSFLHWFLKLLLDCKISKIWLNWYIKTQTWNFSTTQEVLKYMHYERSVYHHLEYKSMMIGQKVLVIDGHRCIPEFKWKENIHSYRLVSVFCC